MLIRNCVQNEDGSLDFDFHVSSDEAAFLMDYSIKSLVHHGLINIMETQEEQEIDLEEISKPPTDNEVH